MLSALSRPPAGGGQTAVLLPSGGQSTLVPVQLSGRSHTPAAARHTVPASTRASAGQSSCSPSQLSASSQAPAAGRQTAVLLVSAGQAGLSPSQNSGRSHTPAPARQRAPPRPPRCSQAPGLPSPRSSG